MYADERGVLRGASGRTAGGTADVRGWTRIGRGGAWPCHLAFALLSAFICALSQASAAPLEAVDYKMAGDAKHTRIVMNFDRQAEPEWFLLRSPHRLVIDLPETRFGLDPKALKARGLIKGVRYGHLEQGSSRLILTAKGPFTVEKLDVLPNETSSGYRLVADIAAASTAEFDAALAVQAETTG